MLNTSTSKLSSSNHKSSDERFFNGLLLAFYSKTPHKKGSVEAGPNSQLYQYTIWNIIHNGLFLNYQSIQQIFPMLPYRSPSHPHLMMTHSEKEMMDIFQSVALKLKLQSIMAIDLEKWNEHLNTISESDPLKASTQKEFCDTKDKQQAILNLAKHTGLYKDLKEHFPLFDFSLKKDEPLYE